MLVSAGTFVAGYFLSGYISEKTDSEMQNEISKEDLELFNIYYESDTPGELVSIIQVLATPEKYYGKGICVNGYLQYEFESYYLYLTKESCDMYITENAIPLYFSDLPTEIKEEDLEKLNGRYVALGGDFEYLGDEYGYGVIKNISLLSYLGNPETGQTRYDIIKEISKDKSES